METPRDPARDADATVSDGFLFGEDEAGQAARQVVSRAELLERLSAVIRSCEGCENVAVIEVTPLDVPDTAGCNWSSSVVLDPAGVAPEVYALAYASVVFMARSSLNLK
jgi:hypothetical protein